MARSAWKVSGSPGAWRQFSVPLACLQYLPSDPAGVLAGRYAPNDFLQIASVAQYIISVAVRDPALPLQPVLKMKYIPGGSRIIM